MMTLPLPPFPSLTILEAPPSSSLPPIPTTNGIDITRNIKFNLDAAKGNYNKWHNFFLYVLSKYNAQDHVEEETNPHLADAEWHSVDVDIILWIYGSISDEL
jgi:hypothetical protein